MFKQILRWIGLAAALVALAIGATHYIEIRANAAPPGDVCDDEPTPEARNYCRNMVDFAMSAGW